jgi:hypothetical protein
MSPLREIEVQLIHRPLRNLMDRLDGWRLVDVLSEMELKDIHHSSKPIPLSYYLNSGSIDIIPSLMVYSNTKSTSR